MAKLSQKLTGAFITVASVMVSGAAFASTGVPQQIPEPGLFGIIAGATAAVILAARLRNK